MGIEAGAEVFQPVECIDAGGFQGTDVISLPWSRVAGCQLIANVIDNFGMRPALTSGQDARYWATLEITIWGMVQGYPSCLKRQQTRMISGPCFYRFDADEFYTDVTVRARNISGGRSGGNQTAPGGGPPAPSSANGFSIQCQVMLVAPKGFVKR